MSIRTTINWIGPTINGLIPNGFVYGLEPQNHGNPSAGSRTYVDLGVGYRFTDWLSARLTITNLAEEKPPLMTTNWNTNTDANFYDVFGRSYSLGLSMEF